LKASVSIAAKAVARETAFPASVNVA